MYSAWIKIDDSLPWIELEETFHTRAEAQEAMKEKKSKVKVKIVNASKSERQIKASITLRH
jgi:PDZ domain-containing secreted protein